MHELVEDDIILKFLGQTYEVLVEVDVVHRGAGAPECPLVLNEEAVVSESVLPCEKLDS